MKVQIQTNSVEVKPTLIDRSMTVLCEMTREQIKESVKSMLGAITDREWMGIIEELSPEILEEMVLEKLQIQEQK